MPLLKKVLSNACNMWLKNGGVEILYVRYFRRRCGSELNKEAATFGIRWTKKIIV